LYAPPLPPPYPSHAPVSQAIKYTGEALAISPTSAKALFRRAAAYEAKKEFELALDDLKAAASHTPTEDKAITKAVDRVKKAIQKEKDKEKKMWGKAFSG
jgi:tetratricopeptide (TPR) repeat protein